MKRTIILISVVCLLAGCGIYKPYSRPVVDVDNLYRDTTAVDSTSSGTLSWKELFTDTRLQELIIQGLEQNTDLRIARLKVEEAEAVLMNARISYLPAVSANASGTISRFDGKELPKTYNSGFSAAWELDIFGKVTNARKGAKAALEGSRAYAQAVQTKLVATIAGSYYTLAMLDRQLQISLSTRKNWERTITVLEALKRAGQTNDVAVLQAKASLMALESTILSIQENITETENSLSTLLAMPCRGIRRSMPVKDDFPKKFAIGVPLHLLSNRPDVRQAEYNLMQSFYATNAARAAFYPNITLSGNAGWTNSGGELLLNPGKWLLSALGSLTQPLFSKGTNIANLKIAKARQEEALLSFQQAILDAGKEVNDALAQWQTANSRIETNTEQVETLTLAVHKTELLMKHSSVNYLEVLTAQQSLLDAEQALVERQFDRIQGIINLYHALGGGVQ
ncbi:efflux transporter outer membrane subunit [Bacteroides gallinarum]|uniref:efflux transporter outer membrane subunit n=1 Tax=Bacteroides gallinarum TaxID=376806 RepID=UPI00036E10C8|nr:efflux transporter outer membrane subunit [Bacteroides gallinarum]